MNLPLQEHAPGIYRLAIDGMQVVNVDGRNHIGTMACDGYFDPPLCGADTSSRNVSRKRDHPVATIPVCRDCAQLAGVEGA